MLPTIGDIDPDTVGDQLGFALTIEDPIHSEANGDDFIDLGDYNYNNYGIGGGGNDKIIGGGQYKNEQKLFGGDGDDKIFTINPSQRGTAIDGPDADTGAYGIAVGNKGKDEIHGNSTPE